MVDFTNIQTATRNLPTINIGADWSYNIVLKDADDVAIDNTGWAGVAHFRRTVDNSTTLLTFSSAGGADGGITFGGADGSIVLTLADTVTDLITWTTAVYDLKLTLPTNEEFFLLRGNVTARKMVTRG